MTIFQILSMIKKTNDNYNPDGLLFYLQGKENKVFTVDQNNGIIRLINDQSKLMIPHIDDLKSRDWIVHF